MDNSLSSIITRLLKFGDTALFSDNEIAKAANQLSEIEFELEFLRNENKVLNEIKREYLLKKTFELEFEKICGFKKHLYIDGVCAECGHVEAQQTQIVANLKMRDYMWTCENGHFNPPQWCQPFCLYCKTPRGES